MKFQKISENEIKCDITSDELIAHGVLLKDLVDNQDKATKFLGFILEQADHEVGFNTSGKLLNVQISVLPNGSLSIIISDDEDTILKSIFKEMKNKLTSIKGLLDSGGDSIIKNGPKKLEDIFSPIIKEHQQINMDIKSKEFDSFDGDEGKEKDTVVSDANKSKRIQFSPESNNITKMSYWVVLDNIDRCIELAQSMKNMPKVPSTLYMYDNKYYLNLKLCMKQIEAVDYICRTIEFGNQLYTDKGFSLSYIKEHGNVILKKDALKTLRKLYL